MAAELCALFKALGRVDVTQYEDLRRLVDVYLVPRHAEKTDNAEVPTPAILRYKMLERVPCDFWHMPHRVFEPCCGKGGFLIDIVCLFMKGLRGLFPDPLERYKVIVEQCLYFADINPVNVFICTMLLDPAGKYALNWYVGDSLTMTHHSKFDLIVSNPPYHMTGLIGLGQPIWQRFVKKYIEWLKPQGFLVCIHPPGWRKPCSARSKFAGLFKLLAHDNQLHYVEIHGLADGKSSFKCGTRYDWYVLEHRPLYKKTVIVDEKGVSSTLYLGSWKWLPNSNIRWVAKVLAGACDQKCVVLPSKYGYSSENEHMSYKRDTAFTHPCVHTTPKSGVRYMYSTHTNNGCFGIKKVVFGDSGIGSAVIDTAGKYGATHHAICLKIDSDEEGACIKQAFASTKFKEVLSACMFSNYQIERELFSLFRRDFWREFIPLN